MNYFVYNYKYFLIGALALVFLFRIIRGLRFKNVNISRELFIIFLVLFVAFLSIQTFEPFYVRANGFEPRTNLEPFKTIKTMLAVGMAYNMPETNHLHVAIVYINLLGNLLIFTPVSFLSAFLFKEPKDYKSILAGFSLSFCIELVQLFLITRSFDVDDLILNTLGTIPGVLAFKLLTLIPSIKRFAIKTGTSERPRGWLWAGLLIFCIIAWALAIFLQQYSVYLRTPFG